MRSKITEIYSLEQLAASDSVLHRLHPGAKLFGTCVFIVAVASFDRYALGELVPFIFYPVVLMAVSGTPYGLVLKRLAVCLPFCLFAGLSSLFFETETFFTLGGMPVSGGMLAFFTLLFRACLLVSAALILVALTPFSGLTAQLRRLKVPAAFVLLFEMTYRYIGVLFEEVAAMHTAYILRGARRKGLDIRYAGSFVGGLLLRSFDRADRVYAAMQLRGYPSDGNAGTAAPFASRDYLFCAAVLLFCGALRFI